MAWKKIPKRWQSTAIGRNFVISPVKMQEYAIYNNQGRVRSVTGRQDRKDVVPDNTWLQKVPKTKGFRMEYPDGDVIHRKVVPNAEAKEKFTKEEALRSIGISEKQFWQDAGAAGGRLSGFTSWNFFTIPKHSTSEYVIKLFWNCNRWIFVKEYEAFFMYSITYKDKARALRMLEGRKISWLGVVEFSSN